MKFILIFPFLIAAGIGQDQSGEIDESFDPDSLHEPVLEWPVILFPGDKIEKKETSTITDTTEEGYRVQVISTQDFDVADSLAEELAPLFDNEVYITFDPPNYKVRVGNFQYRSDAEKAESELKRMGYRTAWILLTRIRVYPANSSRR